MLEVIYRSDNLPRLTNLKVVGDKTGIDRGTRCSDSCAESISQFIEQLEIISTLHATPASHDNLSTAEFRPVALT